MRHIHLLGKSDNLMHLLVPTLLQEMGQAFPELVRARSMIEETLLMEEKRFKETLDRGLFLLGSELKSIPEGGTLSGDVAFKLYDTYGFPLDLTQDALREKGYSVDEDGFATAMERQREKARSAWSGSGDKEDDPIWFELQKRLFPTEFLGYETHISEAQALTILVDGKECLAIKSGQTGQVIFNQTPFYAEAGGQVSDIGTFSFEKGHGVITHVKEKAKLFVHSIKVVEGVLNLNAGATLEIDRLKRAAVCRNHSATHLMHEALRSILGGHVAQRGSLNDFKRTRFDFSHTKPLTDEEITQVEFIVNFYIRQNTKVDTRIMSQDEATTMGARALFGEKYGDEVRVISMGKKENSGVDVSTESYSIELCGGTHVKRTGDVGNFKIISETASASGVRRIECYTGEEAINYQISQENTLKKVEGLLNVQRSDVVKRLKTLFDEKRKMQAEISNLKKKLAAGVERKGSDVSEVVKISDISFVGKILDNVDINNLRELVDSYKKNLGSGVILLISAGSSKLNLICGVTEDLTSQYSAVDIVRKASEVTGGKGGGGRPDMAQAGGGDPRKANEAIESIKLFISNKV